MARRKKIAKKPLQWKSGVHHPITGKPVGGRIMSKEERKVFKTDGKLRKGKRKADYSGPKRKTTRRKTTRRRNPAKKTAKKKVVASSIKVAQTRKTAPGGWKSTMGPYVIVTARGNMVKGGSFNSLAAAKKKLAALRNKGRKGLKLVKVSLSKAGKKRAAPKKRKNPVRRRKTTRRSRRKKSKSKASLKRKLNQFLNSL